MSDLPPPTPLDADLDVPTPRALAGPARRPSAVTGAACVLMLAGALSLVFGLMGITGDKVKIDVPFLHGESAERIAALGLVVLGGLSLVAGWLVLRLRPAGRILGIVLASVGIVTGSAQLRSTGSSGLLALALNAFVIYGLLTYGFVFKTERSPR
jgi:hypothetical protein